jgi:radical SAM superfamily enzyme YgiQ (UPF0313 family)
LDLALKGTVVKHERIDNQVGFILKCFGTEYLLGLDYLDKKLNRQQILESVDKAKKHSLKIQIAFMCGFPGENREHISATLSLIDEIKRIYPLVEINGCFIYTPYPGSTLFDEVQRFGFKPPDSLEGWGRFDPNLVHSTRTTPWISRKNRKILETISSLVRFEFLLKRYRQMSTSEKRAWFFKSELLLRLFDFFNFFFRVSYRLRWRKKWFYWPLEWKV